MRYFPFLFAENKIITSITEVRFRSLPEIFKRYIGGTTLCRYKKQRCHERRKNMNTALTTAKLLCNGGAGIQTYLPRNLFFSNRISITLAVCRRRSRHPKPAETYDFHGHPPRYVFLTNLCHKIIHLLKGRKRI